MCTFVEKMCTFVKCDNVPEMYNIPYKVWYTYIYIHVHVCTYIHTYMFNDTVYLTYIHTCTYIL